MLQKPAWIKVKSPNSSQYHETREIVKSCSLNTVCEEAACPNVGECWKNRHAAFIIMGDLCTRGCGFCNVKCSTSPAPLDQDEPLRLAKAVSTMGLMHVVITSVTRDDLPDGGAGHFAKVINKIHEFSPKTTIEVLTPDFIGKKDAFKVIVDASPDVFNHNIETVPRLYPAVRSKGRYFAALKLLDAVRTYNDNIFTKSGIMVGLGENKSEISQVMDDLRCAGVDFLTIGQYLQPSSKNVPVDRFVTPEEFLEYKNLALRKGFLMVSSSPLTRSSYHAGEDFIKLKKAKLGNK